MASFGFGGVGRGASAYGGRENSCGPPTPVAKATGSPGPGYGGVGRASPINMPPSPKQQQTGINGQPQQQTTGGTGFGFGSSTAPPSARNVNGGFGGPQGGKGFGGSAAFGGETKGFGGPSGGSGSSACRKCGEEGHHGRECPTAGPDKCYNCQGSGHMSSECTEPRKPRAPKDGGEDGGSVKCFNCQEDGHVSRECTKPRLDADGNPKPEPVTYVPDEEDQKETCKATIQMGVMFSRYFDIKVDRAGEGVEQIAVMTSFEDAGLSPQLRENVREMGYDRPTPVQANCIPVVSARRDLMACAQTGSGKTAAFLLPILSSMLGTEDLSTDFDSQQQPRALIIAPTRELAVQICREAQKLAHGTMAKCEVVYGGVAVQYQVGRVKSGCTLLVGTPGRLLQLINDGTVSLAKCRYLVLDEADRMLDMGFEDCIKKVVENAEILGSDKRQTLLFSATFPDAIQQLARSYLNNHVFVTVGLVGGANQDITQSFLEARYGEKKDKLLELLRADEKSRASAVDGKVHKTLVFVQRKRTADILAAMLSQMDLPATSIHGDRAQRQREEALRDFKKGQYPILIATAVAARGLDIDAVDHVINYDLPDDVDDYVHRIGRTGRVGNPGRATSFFDPDNDQAIAVTLVKVLVDAQQKAPDFLTSGGGSFGGEAPAAAFGAPPTAAGDDWNNNTAKPEQPATANAEGDEWD